jgi:glycosyltransferase involved in cell wall biosynthesis
MKIIQVSAYYPPHLGGQEYAVQGLAAGLVNAGHDVSVLTSALGTEPDDLPQDVIGLQIDRLPAKEFGHAAIMPKLVPKLMELPPKDSVVHLHIGQAFTPEAVWAASRLRGYRYIAQLHIDFKPSGPAGVLLPAYKRAVLGPVLRRAAAVIVLNKNMRLVARKVYGVKGPLQIMNNGIDEAFFNISRLPFAAQPPEIPRLLFVGRINPQKNLKLLLDAMAQSKKPLALDIVGDGPDLPEVKALIAKHGLNNVTVHGRLNRHKILDFYANCDALVMPSLYEAQPLVLLEAMAARIPIIGTNVVGVAEHIKDCGIVVEPIVDSLLEGLEKYRKNYADLPQMVERGYAKAESLRWSSLVPEYVDLYQKVLEK